MRYETKLINRLYDADCIFILEIVISFPSAAPYTASGSNLYTAAGWAEAAASEQENARRWHI